MFLHTFICFVLKQSWFEEEFGYEYVSLIDYQDNQIQANVFLG